MQMIGTIIKQVDVLSCGFGVYTEIGRERYPYLRAMVTLHRCLLTLLRTDDAMVHTAV